MVFNECGVTKTILSGDKTTDSRGNTLGSGFNGGIIRPVDASKFAELGLETVFCTIAKGDRSSTCRPLLVI